MVNNLDELFKTYKKEVFRLQTLVEYNVDYEKEMFDKFKQDGIFPDVNIYLDWNNNIKKQTDSGKKFINTNLVLDSGPTQYQKFSFAFQDFQTKLGAQWTFMDKSDFDKMIKKYDFEPFDYWMFDDEIVFEMLYNKNANWLKNREITDKVLIKKLVNIKNEFIENSYDFKTYKKRWSE